LVILGRQTTLECSYLPPAFSDDAFLFPAHIVKVSKDAAVAHSEEEEARTNRSSAPSIMVLVRDAASSILSFLSLYQVLLLSSVRSSDCGSSGSGSSAAGSSSSSCSSESSAVPFSICTIFYRLAYRFLLSISGQ
jgi:hypothetical protein